MKRARARLGLAAGKPLRDCHHIGELGGWGLALGGEELDDAVPLQVARDRIVEAYRPRTKRPWWR